MIWDVSVNPPRKNAAGAQGVGACSSSDARGAKCRAIADPSPAPADMESSGFPLPYHGEIPWGVRGVTASTQPSPADMDEGMSKG